VFCLNTSIIIKLFFSFFFRKKKEAKKSRRKRQPHPFWAPATQSRIGATKKAVDRTVSGFATRRHLDNSLDTYNPL